MPAFSRSMLSWQLVLLLISQIACSDPPTTMRSKQSRTVALSTNSIIINEIDADRTGTDDAEFVELFDGGAGTTDLTGLVLVFINGANDSVYRAFGLDGYTTDENGYFVLCGNAENTEGCDVDVSPDTNLIQNGADAVVLYTGNADEFENGAPISYDGIVDALAYDTSDSDDDALLALLNEGQPQVNEHLGGDKDINSIQRCPNGSGGARNTETYAPFLPTPGSANRCGNAEPEPFSCSADIPITAISAVQGDGSTSPMTGNTITIEGIAVGDFQDNNKEDSGDLKGFYLQSAQDDADTDPATSEGIFVYAPGSIDVQTGDRLRIRGQVKEHVTGESSMTELSNVEIAVCETGQPLPRATAVFLPVVNADALEAYEGMRVVFPQALTIAEYFNFDRYGEIVLAVPPEGSVRPQQPTAVYFAGSAETASLAALNALSRITLDDGRTVQNPNPARHPAGGTFDLYHRFRGGDQLQSVVGVLDDTFGLYRIQPTDTAQYIEVNPRPEVPNVGGDIKVASFNVLNYFTTLGKRGADDATEFERQRTKIFSALSKIDADIVGLIEIENNNSEALFDLTSGLNQYIGEETYAALETGTIGEDEITVALIYKPETVQLEGAFAVLDNPEFLDPNHLGQGKNRPALCQTFRAEDDSLLTVVVNHFKSKGSECGDGDDDPMQGSCNLTRTLAAKALLAWLAEDPTDSGTSRRLIIGDLNAYGKEDPIVQLTAGLDETIATDDDFIDLHQEFGGEEAYSYVFDGQFGYLDYALASTALFDAVTGCEAWHINADEPDILDYDMSFKKDAQDALYEPNPYRASDHDPVIIGIDLSDNQSHCRPHWRGDWGFGPEWSWGWRARWNLRARWNWRARWEQWAPINGPSGLSGPIGRH